MKTAQPFLSRIVEAICVRFIPGLAPRVILGVVLMVFGSTLTLHLDESGAASGKPSWSSQITPLKSRSGAETRPVSLRYQVSWSNLFEAGTIDMTFAPLKGTSPAAVEGTATVQSVGVARVLWNYNSRTRSDIRSDPLIPYRVEHQQTENGVRAEYSVNLRDGVMRVESRITPKDGETVEDLRRYEDLGEIRYVLSSLLFLSRTDLRSNRPVTLLVQPLDRLYLVTLVVQGQESRRVFDKTWNSIRLDVKIRRVEDDLSLAPFGKMHSATLWLSDDHYRLPIEVNADIAVGFISVRLRGRSSP